VLQKRLGVRWKRACSMGHGRRERACLRSANWPKYWVYPETRYVRRFFASRRVACCSVAKAAGVFVSNLLQATSISPWQQLLADHPDLRWDTLEFRREMEGATAYFAALRANQSDLEKIDATIERMLMAYENRDRKAQHQADADFHESISHASHNTMFLYLHTGIVRLLREHIRLTCDGPGGPNIGRDESVEGTAPAYLGCYPSTPA
jgi:hypothetical protein